MAIMSRTKFLDKTLSSVAHAAEQSLFSEVYARKKGLLQSLDVRIKLLSFLCILVLISLLRTPQTLLIAYGFALVLAMVSRISLLFFLKRVWLFVPIFSATVALPVLLNIITPGEPLWVLFALKTPVAWGPYSIPAEISITRQGLWGAITFISRVTASVSFAVLFTLTTKWGEIFSGLRAFLVPRIFVMTLSMTERYLFVFLRMVQDMYCARKSRTIRPLSAATDRNWTASRIGITFKKSLDMGEDVYKAMLSRGFQGEFLTLKRYHASTMDYIWLMTVLCCSGILILLEKGLSSL